MQVEEFSTCDKIIPNKKGHVIPVKTGIQFINNSTQINADWADFGRYILNIFNHREHREHRGIIKLKF